MSSSFLQRWSKNKSESQIEQGQHIEKTENDTPQLSADKVEDSVTEESDIELTMSDVDTLDGNSSISAFMTEGVEKSIKKAALKKIFLSDEFNVVDGLNDYDHDYASVGSLPSEIAQTLRQWINSDDENETDSQTEPVISEANIETNADESTTTEPAVISTVNDEFITEQHENEYTAEADNKTKKTT